ncbi:hypothetical protein [uncultured Cohaesibacter sp.]|uniref:hypothetical protein n=1 Tax=uncultured Cohaesibacter sp. TaxID=1002546 RepID=UPI002AAC1CFC|nr:hypothetical protein [uncultured Cohaesibacter sp.]
MFKRFVKFIKSIFWFIIEVIFLIPFSCALMLFFGELEELAFIGQFAKFLLKSAFIIFSFFLIVGALHSFITPVDDENISLTTQQQIKKIEQTKTSLKGLIVYLESQQDKIAEGEALIKSLKAQEDAIKPILGVNEKTVAAILDAQANRNKENIWKERFIGFGSGVVASIVAALIIMVVTPLFSKRAK